MRLRATQPPFDLRLQAARVELLRRHANAFRPDGRYVFRERAAGGVSHVGPVRVEWAGQRASEGRCVFVTDPNLRHKRSVLPGRFERELQPETIATAMREYEDMFSLLGYV